MSSSFAAAGSGVVGGSGGIFGELVAVIRSARRGLLVVAGGGDAADALAAAEIARLLGWAVVADAASGLRVKGAPAVTSASSGSGAGSNLDDNLEWSAATGECPGVIDCLDLMLVSPEVAAFARPDVIVQINPRLTSKRVQTMLEAAALDDGAAWAAIVPQDRRADPGHCVSLHVASDASTAAAALTHLLSVGGGGYAGSAGHASCGRFGRLFGRATQRRLARRRRRWRTSKPRRVSPRWRLRSPSPVSSLLGVVYRQLHAHSRHRHALGYL